MDSLSVWQQNDPQIPATHLSNLCPSPNSTIGLDYLLHRIVYHPLDPLDFDECTIRALAHFPEVFRGLHVMTLAEAGLLRKWLPGNDTSFDRAAVQLLDW